MAQLERKPAAEIDLISPELLKELQEIKGEQTQSEEITPATEGVAELDLWADLFFEEENENGVPTMQCIKTQKRRDLMMKKTQESQEKEALASQIEGLR